MSDLKREEMETHFSQTAEERARGVWHVYSDDPYWIRRLEKYGKPVGAPRGEGKHYEIEHRQITLRKPSHMLAPRSSRASNLKSGGDS